MAGRIQMEKETVELRGCGTVVVGIKIQQRHNYVLPPQVILLQPTTSMHLQ